jgi:hypothetical protein
MFGARILPAFSHAYEFCAEPVETETKFGSIDGYMNR